MQNGISIYPGLDNTLSENLALIETAAALGLPRLFTSLHIPETDPSALKRELGVLLKAARERLLSVAPAARGAGSATWAPSRLRSSGLAGKALGLCACEGATLAECLCLAEAVIGDKGREALVRAYGEEAVRKAVGSPADPVTAAAVGAVMRDIQALMGERDRRLAEIDRLETLEMREVREKWHAERKRAIEERNAAVAALNARIAELRRETGDGEGEA